MKGPPPCEHPTFEADVVVNRIEDIGRFVAGVQIRCSVCGVRMRFVGAPAGLSYERPMVSVDEFELRAPITPDAHMTTLMAGSVTGFRVRPNDGDPSTGSVDNG